jgi:hypothetical protein
MTKQIINIGVANKGNGDPIRTAFDKVNQNFTEIYNAIGLGDGSLNIGAFEFTGSTMTTTDSSDIVIAQRTQITSNLAVSGQLTVNGTVIKGVTQSTTAPGNAAAGELWWDTAGGNLYIYYGSSWAQATVVPSNTAYTPSTSSDWSGTPPSTISDALDRLAAVVKTLNSGIGA